MLPREMVMRVDEMITKDLLSNSQLIILNCSFLHHCEQRLTMAWVDNEIENTEICMKLSSWT